MVLSTGYHGSRIRLALSDTHLYSDQERFAAEDVAIAIAETVGLFNRVLKLDLCRREFFDTDKRVSVVAVG